MARKSPLPWSREILMDLLRQVDRVIEHHDGLRSAGFAAMDRRREIGDGITYPIRDPAFRMLTRRFERIHLEGQPPAHAFAEHIDFPIEVDFDDPGAGARIERWWAEADALGPDRRGDVLSRLLRKLRADIVARVEALVAPDWIEGYRSELNRACNRSETYSNYFEKAAERGELELVPRTKKILAIRFADRARHEDVWRKLQNDRNL